MIALRRASFGVSTRQLPRGEAVWLVGAAVRATLRRSRLQDGVAILGQGVQRVCIA
jgi:hypothetical protein